MDIFIWLLFVFIMMAMGVLAKEYQIVGFVAGIGLVMMAFTVQTSGLDVATGVNVTQASNITSTVTVNYANLFTYYPGLSYFQNLITILIGGIGILFVAYAIG